MVSVVEQARQNPANATPLGWDVTEVKYPAVNTCATVTACGQKGLVGLHLGLMMAPFEGKKEGEAIDNSYLDMYLNMTRQQASVRAAATVTRQFGNLRRDERKLDAIYVAGALGVWSLNAPKIWARLKDNLDKFAKETGARLEYFQFSDKKVTTVDIYVTKGAVKFTEVGNSGSVVSRDGSFRP